MQLKSHNYLFVKDPEDGKPSTVLLNRYEQRRSGDSRTSCFTNKYGRHLRILIIFVAALKY